MKFYILPLILFALPLLQAQTPYERVNPFIGTGGHGHTYPGATAPFGMVQLSPDTRLEGWDGCGGYHYDDTICYGFSHTHLSGTGVADYCDILVRPALNPLSFSHKNETANPGFYSVIFNNGIKAEMVATERMGVHRYTFPDGAEPLVVIDLNHRDQVIAADMSVIRKGFENEGHLHPQIMGYRNSKSWAQNQKLFFTMDFSAPIDTVIWLSKSGEQKRVAVVKFPRETTVVEICTGLSAVSEQKALFNIEDWYNEHTPFGYAHFFENTARDVKKTWENALSRIEIKGTPEQETVFYTALYHTLIVPNIYSDADGEYRGMDDKIHKGGNQYTVFSLWDTYRGAHPLYTLIEQKRTEDFIRTFENQFAESGRLPVWELAGNETDCMIGYHAVSVIADAAAKGIYPKISPVYLAMVATADKPVYGLDAYAEKGFLSAEDESESVSKTLEYAYDDWCISRMAEWQHHVPEQFRFEQRSKSWSNLLDARSGHMRPRENGRFLQPFDPREVNNHFTEANSWQYSFYVPHDLKNYIAKLGGAERAERLLDSLFAENSKTTGREQSDITGLIGQYAHGNEPSHHIAYLYNSVGKPFKTQQRVKQILETMYNAKPDGLSGNEDCGQMSAWYVLSSLGFYPVCPGDARYSMGYPLFKSAALNFENGKTLKLIKKGKGNYIKSVNFNGKNYTPNYLKHEEIMAGGTLIFTMGKKPGKWGSAKADRFMTEVNVPYASAPIIEYENATFDDSVKVHFIATEDANIYPVQKYYSQNTVREMLHLDCKKECTLTIDTTVCVDVSHYMAEREQYGTKATACFYKRPNHWKVQLLCEPNRQYTAGGPQALTDGLKGDAEWRKGRWVGVQGQEFQTVIDLGEIKPVSYVSLGVLQDTRAWIALPKELTVMFSEDGREFTGAVSVSHSIPMDSMGSFRMELSAKPAEAVKARYVRLIATNPGKLPEWHPGAGGETFIFADEVEIK
ncbi:MAG: GH92 family glycosyl hydrolase [Bacteroidetes bacterium]|nr:GH92 family glycosyl hydrolase [Bacteroidota bacterium]